MTERRDDPCPGCFPWRPDARERYRCAEHVRDHEETTDHAKESGMSHTVDKCLDEIDRLKAQRAATQGHLWASEHLLAQVAKLLPEMLATTPAIGAYRDKLVQDITKLLSEDREHPGRVVGAAQGEGAAPTAPGV